MVRIRVYTKEGTYLARKGVTLREMKSWQKAYNAHNKDKVLVVTKVPDRKPIKKSRVSGGLAGMAGIRIRGWN